MIHREFQSEECFLRPCSEEGSDATKTTQNNFRLRQQCRTSKLTFRRRGGSWVEPLPISEIEVNIVVGRYVKGTSPFDITVTSDRLRWHRNQSHTCAPCKHKVEIQNKQMKFYIYADGPHTHTIIGLGKFHIFTT